MQTLFQTLTPGKRRALLTCCLAMTGAGLFSLSLGSVLPDLVKAYGLTDGMSGVIISAHSVGNLLSGFVSALVYARLGDRKGVLVLAAMACIGFTLATLWGAPAFLLLCFALLGFGRGSTVSFSNAVTNRVSDGSPAAANMLHCGFAVGAVAAPLVFLLLSGLMDWRLHIWAAVGYMVLILLLVSRLRAEDMGTVTDMKQDPRLPGIAFFRKPAYLISAAMMFFYLCSEYTVNGFLVTYLQNKESLLNSILASGETVKSFSQKMATLLWTGLLIGRFTCALVVKKERLKQVLLLCSAVMTAFFILLLTGTTTGAVTVAVIGLGLGMSGVSPMIYADAADYCNGYRLANGFLMGLGSMGSVVMPTLVGTLAERFGFSVGMGAVLAAIVGFVLFSSVNVLYPRLKKR